jgi:hypothetical protein
VVVPFYKTAAENFDVTPAQLAVDVNAATSALAFTVFGFSAHGRVIDRNGAGIAGAKVLVDGRHSAVTDAKGVYRLEGIAAGTYTIEATKEHHGFQVLKNVELSAAHVNAPEIVVLRFAVCGAVEALENKQGRSVTLVGESQKQLTTYVLISSVNSIQHHFIIFFLLLQSVSLTLMVATASMCRRRRP